MLRKLYITLLLLIVAIPSAFAASVKITESPARGKRSIEVGDMFYFNIQVSDLDAAPEKPANVPGARLMYFERTGQSSSFTNINGKTTQSHSYTYTATLRATKEGSYTFGPITVGGVKSNVVSYTIGKAGANTQPNAQSSSQTAGQSNQASDKPKYIGKGDGNLFLRASVSNSNPYEQQAVIYTVKLYTTYDAIKFIGAAAAPKFDGFVIDESKDLSQSLSYETYQGKTYATAVIAKYIIFPQMTGNLKISGNTYTISVDQREYYQDPFFGSMSYATPLQLNVTPNDLQVSVKPLPQPKPVDFSGGVGQFKLTSDLRTRDPKTNQAASIVYQISGTGNIKYVQLPDLATLFPPELEVYSPKSDQNITVSGSNTSGNISFDYSFMPLEEGEFKIPDIKLVYFNPTTGKYETSVAKGYTIHVGKGASSSKSQSVQRLKFNPDLQPVKLSKLSKTPVAYVEQTWYWIIYIVAFLLLAGSFFTYRRYINLHADMVSFNSRRADKLAKKRLRKAAAAMRKNCKEDFYTELLKALWGYIGDKMKMPTSELMRDNIRQVMESKGVEQDSIDAFINMIDDAEFAKYSSAVSSISLQDMYSRAADLINNLEKSFKKNL
jgi:hypothetical protein